jgi:hypothetical protein
MNAVSVTFGATPVSEPILHDIQQGATAQQRQDSAASHMMTLWRALRRPEGPRNQTEMQSCRDAGVVFESGWTEETWRIQGSFPEGGF